jgi:prepilin-type N-terminal cleavage/methylation domain-containing protein/prepilin-type processing-associated H-X9-DG protein
MKTAFTLIELLVVIAIIAILAAILFPVFAQAREKARQSTCISNTKQLGLGVLMYAQDYDEQYPMMSFKAAPGIAYRIRWADQIYPYVKNEALFLCPSAPKELSTKFFYHRFDANNNGLQDDGAKYGGYGFNYQYLGNSRFPWSASLAEIEKPAETVAICDTSGVAYEIGRRGVGDYVVDPPLTSLRGSGKASGFYGDGAECGGVNGCRSMPAERHNGMVSVGFTDGHSKAMKRVQLEDYNRDGTRDNGWWNGRGDHLSL